MGALITGPPPFIGDKKGGEEGVEGEEGEEGPDLCERLCGFLRAEGGEGVCHERAKVRSSSVRGVRGLQEDDRGRGRGGYGRGEVTGH